MPLFIPFLVKGAIVLGKAIIASKKVAVVSKAVVGSVHTVGAATTVTVATTACVVVGGIAWSTDRVDDLKECYGLWETGNNEAFYKKTASLLGKFVSISTDSIATSAKEILTSTNLNAVDVARFGKDFLDLMGEIEIEKRRPPIS